jgi:REP element-mobilizing transposase RayT
MKYNPDIHHRRSIRLKEYDYSQSGVYFVTICVHNRECLLGDIMDTEMRLSDAGMMVKNWWNRLPSKFSDIEMDEFVIMPNHIHGVIINVGADPCVCPDPCVYPDQCVYPNIVPSHRVASPEKGEHTGSPLHRVVQWFKTMTTNEYIRNVKRRSWRPFHEKFWQRNYYEHVIRHEDELTKIREYIRNNPSRWSLDRENPDRNGSDQIEAAINKKINKCPTNTSKKILKSIFENT